MQKKSFIANMISLLLCTVLIVAMALCTTGCGEKTNEASSSSSASSSEGESAVKEVGEGETQFSFIVTDKDGNETPFLVSTDKETVGEALLENELIEGEESEYGLFIKKVNGITADYDVDKTYWAFYINGGYATSGVDSTRINPDDTYMLKVEK